MIDQSRLQELAEDFGSEDLADLIDAFLEEATEALQALANMVSDADMDARRNQFHFLKGCALNVGAMQLAKVCEGFEHGTGGFSEAEYLSVLADFHAVQLYFADGGMQNVA